MRGIFEYGGKICKPKSKLSIEDVKLIAYEARKLDILNSYANLLGSDFRIKT